MPPQTFGFGLGNTGGTVAAEKGRVRSEDRDPAFPDSGSTQLEGSDECTTLDPVVGVRASRNVREAFPVGSPLFDSHPQRGDDEHTLGLFGFPPCTRIAWHLRSNRNSTDSFKSGWVVVRCVEIDFAASAAWVYRVQSYSQAS
mgnify:CR=1 FL=1